MRTFMEIVTSLARHYEFDVETPWEDLPQKTRKALLEGSGSEAIEFRQLQVNGRTSKKRQPFEGFVPYMERRYRETQSPRVREELAKYLGNRPLVRDCGGHPSEPHGPLCIRGRLHAAADRAPLGWAMRWR